MTQKEVRILFILGVDVVFITVVLVVEVLKIKTLEPDVVEGPEVGRVSRLSRSMYHMSS